MTDPNPIRQPGVDIVQSVRTTTPVVSTPLEVPVVVGPCKKVLETTLTDGSLNEDARIALPALYQPLDAFAGVVPTTIQLLGGAGETMVVEVNAGPGATIAFAGGAGEDWTLNRFVDWVNSEAGRLGMSILAEKVMVSTTNGFARIRTTAIGDPASLKIIWGGTFVLATFLGLSPSWTASGCDRYNNRRLVISQDLLPDPWSLRPDLDILESTVRAFLSSNTAVLKELQKTQTVSRAGKSWLIMEDDLDGDGVTPLLKFVKDDAATPAYSTDALTVPAPTRDANVPNFSVVPTSASFTSTGYAPVDAVFTLGIDGWEEQTITIPTGMAVADAKDLINRYFPGRADVSGVELKLDSLRFGRESLIRISGTAPETVFGGAANTYPKTIRGIAQQVAVGDEIRIDGSLFGVISQIVSVAAGASIVRLDREYAVDYLSDPLIPADPTEHEWWIVAKGLTASLQADLNTDKPTPDLYVTQYLVQFRHDSLRGSAGQPLYPPMNAVWAKAQLPLFYAALRLDVTARATTRDRVPVLIQGNDYQELAAQFAPLDAQNPVGLAAYKMLENSGPVPVALFGIDEVSDTYPDGTPEAYARAFARLEAYKDGYAIAVLSQELEVHLALAAHVAFMSRAKSNKERIGFVTAAIPTRDEPTLVGSSTEGNASLPGGATATFETGLIDLGDLFLAAGVTKTVFDAGGADGIYLNIEGSLNNYLVTGYSGTTLTCSTYAGTDSFWSAALWASIIIDKTFSISVRGKLLVTTAGDPDELAIARAIGRRAPWFKSRRMICGAPGMCEMVVGGLAQRLPTYYLAAATAALRCSVLASTPLTGRAVAGFTKVIQANDYFSDDQMDVAAGYGIWWWYNEGGRVVNRHQLTTDPTSVKTRELSITTALDFGTKVIRATVQPLAGVVNINTETTQQVMVLLQGAFDFILAAKIWVGAHNPTLIIGPFTTTPDDLAEGLGDGGEDEVVVTVNVELAPPFNRIRIRLIVA